MKGKKIALIPAYEPDDLLLDLLSETKQAGFEIIVVDDGSGAAFSELFRQAAAFATVLTHAENRGKGRALKTGMAYIMEHFESDYVIVTLDADGQHTVSDAKKICEAVQTTPLTLILGSRNLKEKVPFRSQFGNTITRLAYRLSTGLWIHDTQTGLRAFGKQLLPELAKISGERYEYEMNVLLECARQQIPIHELKIDTIYINNNSASHFNTLSDSYRVYKEILKFSASSFAGFLVDYTMYSLLLLLTANFGSPFSLQISNIAARIVSASVNYVLNRNLVFKDKNSGLKSTLQYFTLAALILLGNTLLLSLLVEELGVNRLAAKIGTEILFFFLSWFVQRHLIFRQKEKRPELGSS